MENKTALDYSKIFEITKNCELFKKIIEEQGSNKIHIDCCKSMKIVTFSAGENILQIGEPAGNFYVILEGKVSVKIPFGKLHSPRTEEDKREPKKKFGSFIGNNEKYLGASMLNKVLHNDYFEEVRILTTGDVFGELGLINEKPRSATITAKTRTVLGMLVKEVFHKLLAHHAERSLKEKLDFLQSLPIFKTWSRNYLMKISFYFSLKKITWNQILYKFGSPCSNIYFVYSGDVMLTQAMSPDIRKNINKYFKSFSQQVDLQLVKKSKGMILGIEEVLAGETCMRNTAKCSSAYAEVYVLSKNDFDSRIMKPEFFNVIKDNYLENQEFIQSRFVSSCLTQRAKLDLGKGLSEKVLKKRIKLRKIVRNQKVENGPALILYNNRRSGSMEVLCGKRGVFGEDGEDETVRKIVNEGGFKNSSINNYNN